MEDLRKRIEKLEQINELQSQHLEHLNKRLKHQEKLMRYAAIFMVLLLFVWLFTVTWLIP